MKFEKISHKKNNALKREEYILSIESEKNPTKQEVLDFLKGDSDLTIIKEIKGSFGKNEFRAEVLVYESKEVMDKSQPIPRKIRKKLAEEAKKAAEAAKVA